MRDSRTRALAAVGRLRASGPCADVAMVCDALEQADAYLEALVSALEAAYPAALPFGRRTEELLRLVPSLVQEAAG